MKKSLAKSLVLTLVLLLSLTVTSLCSAGKIDDVEKTGVIKIGTTMDYVPMSYLDPKTGELKGFEIDLANKIAAMLEWKIEFVQTSWPTLHADTSAGIYDMAMSGITRTPYRMKKFAMSNGYGLVGKTILCRKKDAKKFTGIESMNQPQVRVMVNPGGTNEKFAHANLSNCTLLVHQVNNEIPGLIGDGKADIMITEVVEARSYIKSDPRLAAPLLDKPLTCNQWGIIMQKGDQEFLNLINYCLDVLTLDGTLNKLCKQYNIL